MIVNRGSEILVAELAELVDALDSGSSVRLGLPGSSPGFRIGSIRCSPIQIGLALNFLISS